jgi:phosphohistidine phosphatase
MKALLLLRHGKTSWNDPTVSDSLRPLSATGKYNVYQIGKLLKNTKLLPDLIISSSAKRTKDTSTLLAEYIGYNETIYVSELLYETSPIDYVNVISEVSNNIYMVLLVGHNPILENLIQLITSELIILETCSLVHIVLPITKWIEIKTNPKCKLIQRVTIKELD